MSKPPSKKAVNYRRATQADGDRRCNNCRHDDNGFCQLLQVEVHPPDVCDRWIRK